MRPIFAGIGTMRFRQAIGIGIVALSGACSDFSRPVTPLASPGTAQAEASVPALPTFEWFAPVGAGVANAATFNAVAAPTVEICAWNGANCTGSPVARFSTVAGVDVLPLSVNATIGQYEANWSLLSTTFTTRKTYRIRVLQGPTELGAVLVDVVRGRWALARSDGKIAPLVSSNALPIRFGVAMAAERTLGPAGGEVMLADGASFVVPPGALQGTVTFSLRRTGALPVLPASIQAHASLRDPEPSCINAPYALSITRGVNSVFLPGPGPFTLNLPTVCGPAPGQTLFAHGDIDGVAPAWRDAEYDARRPAVATLSFTGADLLPLNERPTTTLSLTIEPHNNNDALRCAAGGIQYPRIAEEISPTAGLTPARVIVLIHGWIPDIHDCFDFNVQHALGSSITGARYFANLLPALQGLLPDARTYTYSYPTYRRFTEPGADLAFKLDSVFGLMGPQSAVAQIVLVGHSMGGLVARSAAQQVSASVSAKLRIITLGTPHLGTPGPALRALGFGFANGMYTPGGESLLNEAVAQIFPHPELELTPIIAYGSSMLTRCRSDWIRAECTPGAGRSLELGWNALCNYAFTCDSDGAVERSSSLSAYIPDSMLRRGTSTTWANYSHNELKDGRGQNDPIFAAVAEDIRRLAPSMSPAAPSNLVAVARGSSLVRLSWTDNSTNEEFFKVETAPSLGGPYTAYTVLAPNVTSVQVRVAPTSTNYFRVVATRAAQASAPSNAVTVTALSPFPWNAAAGATGVNGKIYAFSPRGYYMAGQASATYDPTADLWTLGPTFTSFGDFGGASAPVAIGNRVFIVGGTHAYAGPYLQNSLLIYNTSSDTWSVGTAHPTPTFGGVAGAIGNLLYVFTSVTGLDNANGSAVDVHALYRYDPARDVWSAMPPPPQRYSQRTGGAIGNRFYLIGGVDANGQPVPTVDIFDPATNTWTTGRPMPRPRYLASSAVDGNKMYVVGGYRSGATYCGEVDEVDMYDAATNSWTARPPLSFGRALSAVAIVQNQLYVAGGVVSCFGLSGDFTTDVEVLDLFQTSSMELLKAHSGLPPVSNRPPTIKR